MLTCILRIAEKNLLSRGYQSEHSEVPLVVVRVSAVILTEEIISRPLKTELQSRTFSVKCTDYHCILI